MPGDKPNLWDEFTPVLYTARSVYRRLDSKPWLTAKSVTFGLREISTQGTQFLINGRKTFFRGTLECCIFPLTGHPPTDVESWKRIIRIAKALRAEPVSVPLLLPAGSGVRRGG